MRRNVFLKSAMRKPLKSLIVFLLIGVISFGFMVKLVEYMVVTDETAKLEEYYKPVGRLRPESLENDPTAEGVEFLRNDPAVDYLDINRSYTGVMDQIPVGKEVTIKYFSDSKPENLPEKGKQYLWRAEVTKHSVGYSGDMMLAFRAMSMGDGAYFYPVTDGVPEIANPDIAEDIKVRREAIYHSIMVTAKDMTRMPAFSSDFYAADADGSRADTGSASKSGGPAYIVQTGSSAGMGQALRYMSRHLVRTSGRGIMAVVVLAAFIFGLGWLQSAMKLNEEKIETLYHTVEMTGNIVPKQIGVSVYDKIGNIPKWAVTDLEETQRFSEIRAQTEENVTVAAIDEKNQETGHYGYGSGGPNALVINHKNAYASLESGTTQIEFLDGYDMSVFEGEKYKPEAETVIVRKDVLEMLGCSLGDRVKLIVSRSATFITNAEVRSQIYTIAGSFTEDEPSGYEVILPSCAYENLVGTSGVYYTDVEFSAAPSQNRKINEFKAEMKEILSDYSSADYIQVDYNLNESELTNAVEPLEKNNALMRVLYPIVLAVAVLVTMLLCVLLTVQSYKETAIMRVLGTTKLRIGIILSVERLIVCAAGLCAGIVLSVLTLDGISENILITILGCAVICLLSGAAASIISAAVSVIRRPLEFLQVKE